MADDGRGEKTKVDNYSQTDDLSSPQHKNKNSGSKGGKHALKVAHIKPLVNNDNDHSENGKKSFVYSLFCLVFICLFFISLWISAALISTAPNFVPFKMTNNSIRHPK